MYSKLILMLQMGCLAKVIVKYICLSLTAQHCLITFFYFYFVKCVISQITSHLSQ